ncbi:hypothetical protein Tco_0320965 [Tanacetum coccineum]
MSMAFHSYPGLFMGEDGILFSNDTWVWNWNKQSIGGRNVAALEVMISEIGNLSFSNRPDAWSWKILEDDIFYVQATRSHIDNCLLPSLHPTSRWSKFLPRKIISIACPSCNVGMESNDHVLFECDTASSIWCLVHMWTHSNMPSFSSS